MHQQINRWIDFFQGLIFTKFRQDQPEAIEVLTWLIVGHLFGLFNPNQFADALGIDKSSLYTHLATWSLDQWKRFLVQVGCHQAVERIQQTESMSASTQSRRNITSSVDDTVCDRNGKVLSYCYHWYSGRFHAVVNGQNIIAITIKIGSVILPVAVRLVGKQGRANTEKPQILKEMIAQIEAVFAPYGISLTDYPISFDSWYGSQPLREQLEAMGFDCIIVHAKSNYVFEIDGQNAKLSAHKKTIDLQDHQWGCDGPVNRKQAQSPTFGDVVLLFFSDGGQKRCVMAFGRRLRSAEIFRIWHQHHAIEQFWRNLKSIVGLKSMHLHGRTGAYAGLAVKVLAYLLLTAVSSGTGLTFQKIILQLSGQRTLFFEIFEHFHPPNATGC
ncbi:MAG: transposase [Chlamydiae bacterium]|nr:transposase [Chlamydiota bacterium]